MRLLDTLRGSRGPDPGVSPRPAGELRAALLAIGEGGVPWTVAEDDEGRLVATWDLGGDGSRRRPHATFRVVMRLDEATHAVHAIDELAKRGGVGRSVQRGNIAGSRFRKTYMRGPDGYELVSEERSSNADLRDRLRAAVTGAGWAWSGRLIRKP